MVMAKDIGGISMGHHKLQCGHELNCDYGKYCDGYSDYPCKECLTIEVNGKVE